MKKSNFVAILLGTLSILCFGIGMCMCTISEWNMFHQGVVIGILGCVLALVTIFIYRKMEHIPFIKLSFKTIMLLLFGIAGSLCLGAGMSLTMVFNSVFLGIIIGIVGIFMLLCLIPLCRGLK